MKKWRVVRVNRQGTLDVSDVGYWTKNGAQEAANHLNKTFGAMEALANALVGHNYWVTTIDKITMLDTALRREKARQEREKR